MLSINISVSGRGIKVSLVTKKANSKIYINGHSRMHGGNQTNNLNIDFKSIFIINSLSLIFKLHQIDIL